MQVFSTSVIVLLLLLSSGCSATPPSSHEPVVTEQNLDELITDIENKHPVTYFLLAANLFKADDKDQAVEWYYIGQMRFRAYLMANPDLDPSADGALYASLKSVLGPQINEHAGADPDKWVTLINNAINWHQSHPNGHTPKNKYPDIYAEVEAGFMSFKEQVAKNKDEIRKQREQNGLPNHEE